MTTTDPRSPDKWAQDIAALSQSTRFQAIRDGATIVSSGLTLQEQLRLLLELVLAEVTAADGCVILVPRRECACDSVHVAGCTEKQLRKLSQAPGSRVLTHQFSSDTGEARVCLLFTNGRQPSVEDRTMLELLSKQMMTALDGNPEALFDLLTGA